VLLEIAFSLVFCCHGGIEIADLLHHQRAAQYSWMLGNQLLLQTLPFVQIALLHIIQSFA